MILLVTYDLKGFAKDYEGLHTYLKSHDGWSHYMASTWLIDTKKTPEQVADDTRPFLQDGDRMLIVRFNSNEPYQGWLPDKAWEWIKRHSKKSD
jgi:hypothetical protein